jgi:cold shock protein
LCIFTFELRLKIKMLEGTVKFYHQSKGFGYILETESQEEHFVHVSGLINKIKDNDIVSFELEDGERGPRAVEVRVIKASEID